MGNARKGRHEKKEASWVIQTRVKRFKVRRGKTGERHEGRGLKSIGGSEARSEK